jgi:predicted ATP-grasp superfamily ATP-dependent carboligase
MTRAPGIDTRTPVVVLKMTTNVVQHGVLGIVRSAGRWGIPVYWVHNEDAAPAAHSRYLTGVRPLPPGAGTAEHWIEHLKRVGRELGGRPLLVATDDPGTALLADHASALEPSFRFPVLPDGLVASLVDKRGLHAICRRVGVPTPAAQFPQRRDDLHAYAAAGRFPVVVKRIGAPPVEGNARLASVMVVDDAEELRALADGVADDLVPFMMLQEYIPGGPRSVWMLDGYFDARSDCLAAFTGRKLRQHPTHTGMTSLGVCEHNAEVIAATERLMKEIGYRGVVDMGYRFDARDGAYKLLDVNPRIGATFRLFVDSAGTDVLRALYLDMTGQPPRPRAAASEGRRWIVEHHDALEVAGALRRRELGVRSWLASMLQVREAAWFSPRDPFPAMALTMTFARRGATRRLRPAALRYRTDEA